MPDGETAEVDQRWAKEFIARGRAVPVKGAAKASVGEAKPLFKLSDFGILFFSEVEEVLPCTEVRTRGHFLSLDTKVKPVKDLDAHTRQLQKSYST